MKTFVNTKKTFLGLDSNNRFITNRDIEVGITIEQLLYFKEQGGTVGFPFSKLFKDQEILSLYTSSPEAISNSFLYRGYTKDNKGQLKDFREVYKVSNVLELVKFYDVETLNLKNTGLIFTLHNGVDCIPIETDFKAFREHFKKKYRERQLELMKEEKAFIKEAEIKLKGWYEITLDCLAFKKKGNDGWISKSTKCVADSKMDAYNKTIDYLKDQPKDPNVLLYADFQSVMESKIVYIGSLSLFEDTESINE